MKIEHLEVSALQSGDKLIFEDFETSGDMWAGDGDREVRYPIDFDRPFIRPPAVHLSVTLLDVSNETPIRYDLTSENVTMEGFDIVFKTWLDTHFARVRVNWIAIGSAIRDEYWIDF